MNPELHDDFDGPKAYCAEYADDRIHSHASAWKLISRKKALMSATGVVTHTMSDVTPGIVNECIWSTSKMSKNMV
jgi:hypothetical protein